MSIAVLGLVVRSQVSGPLAAGLVVVGLGGGPEWAIQERHPEPGPVGIREDLAGAAGPLRETELVRDAFAIPILECLHHEQLLMEVGGDFHARQLELTLELAKEGEVLLLRGALRADAGRPL